jgi:hypothetical protein
MNDTHTNFWPAMDGSSSHKSTYLGFVEPSGRVFLSKVEGLANGEDITDILLFSKILFILLYNRNI